MSVNLQALCQQLLRALFAELVEVPISVLVVAEDRMPDRRHLYADLVCASREELDFKQACFAVGREHAKAQLAAERARVAFATEADKRIVRAFLHPVDEAAFALRHAAHDGVINLS